MGTKGLEVGGKFVAFVDLEHVEKEEKSFSFCFENLQNQMLNKIFPGLIYCTLKGGGKSVRKKMLVPPNHGTKDTVVAPSRDHLAKTKKGMLRPLWDVGVWV